MDGKIKASSTVVAYSDADWAGDHDTRRSTSGCLIKAFGMPVLYSSKRQRSISRSTLESEYISASTTAQDLQRILHFLHEPHIEHESPVPFFMDNTSAILAITNGAVTDKTKHIDISHKIVKELYRSGITKPEYLETEQMMADILTKPLSRQRSTRLMELVGIVGIGKDGKKCVSE